ncbi:hypothetical protein GCM10007414_29730 [Agarivorans gilvus]|uniref:Uncharacterized protein n=1 Tax=Agarivorans gilvus TaxID=680279 RepID=A0ABQ1I5M0_9ALTE|nr:hypothetical protein GCM10007414_29730 [Agarivorans gilvus]
MEQHKHHLAPKKDAISYFALLTNALHMDLNTWSDLCSKLAKFFYRKNEWTQHETRPELVVVMAGH